MTTPSQKLLEAVVQETIKAVKTAMMRAYMTSIQSGMDPLMEQVDVQAITHAAKAVQIIDDSNPSLKDLIDGFPELNLSNYDDDGVAELNIWGIEVCQAYGREYPSDKE